ncbi:MAG: UDP-N-acetylmuramate--L-alanine ligase [Erysipelotrichaceae bacterium]|nr:UDP-N-acetylmuramate--L-alanine ligase [Erysipelotrichaceae bacterium]
MRYHFIGIKGSGMASLATILKDQGEDVQGSDIEKYIFTQKPLEERHIPILPFAKENVPQNAVVIIGNAFDEDHEEVKQARSMSSVTCYRYHEYLGKLMENYCSISVAGTHGKTTTTGMLAHVMSLTQPCGYLIGDGSGSMPKNAHYFVVESCEYQRHFLAYHPDYAIITNMELDHVDYYHDMDDYRHAFQTFANQVKKGVVLFGDDKEVRNLSVDIDHLYYGLNDNNDVQAKNIVTDPKGMTFDVYKHDQLFGSFRIPFVGKPFLWNSLGVIAVGIMEGMDVKTLQEALSTFQGVKRRFHEEVQGENVYIDDYAHHPTAISLTIEAAKMKYPNRKVIAIFKPDRFSRIAYFLHEFAKALDQADDVFLCEFPNNAKKENGVEVTIQDLCDLSKKAKVIKEDEEGAAILAKQSPAVYLFMSSKDIYKLKNIVKSFQ